MTKSRRSRLPLLLGVLAPLLSAAVGVQSYRWLTRWSDNPDEDYLVRLSAVAALMLLPPLAALFAAFRARRRGPLGWDGRIGAAIALLACGMAALPINGAVRRHRQATNLALSGVPAPEFHARDLDGTAHRLSDHRGSVVLINIWATWCPPCRAEMPELDRLARENAADGLRVFGVSVEDRATQEEFRENVLEVGYPLLLPGELGSDDVPDIFVETARYPANFLVDRNGMLHAAPSTDQPFSVLEAEVDRLLAERPASN